MWLVALGACGGGTPTSPGQTQICTPVVGPTSLTLRVGELFRLRFTVPAGVTRDDVLVVFIADGATTIAGESRASFRLYDGATLLGAQELQDSIAFFKSAESSFGNPGDLKYGLIAPAAIVNFDTIVSGTIAGRVEFSVVSGTARMDSLEKALVALAGPIGKREFGEPVPTTQRELCR